MNIFSLAFNEILYRPILNLLVGIYNILPWQDIGIAIVLITVLIRIVFFPLSRKAIKSQKQMGLIQSEIKKIKEKNKNNKEAEVRETMEFYKKHKINPFSGCLPILIQLPVLFALYRVFLKGLSNSTLNDLYSFVHNPGIINSVSLGIIDLSQKNVYLAVLAAIFQFLQSKMMAKINNVGGDKSVKNGKPDIAKMLGFQMTYFMPVMTLLIGVNLPAGLMLFWILTTLASIIEQKIIFRKERRA